jgi:hypothetical protein
VIPRRLSCSGLEIGFSSSVEKNTSKVMQFDNYIEQINNEECDLLLTVIVKGDSSHLLPFIPFLL